MSEREPIKVPINIVEAIDEEAPVVNEFRRALAVVAIANRALAVYGVELVTNVEIESGDE